MAAFGRHIEALSGAVAIMPSSLAWAVYQEIVPDNVDPILEWACLEHLKALARRALAGRFMPDGEENTAHQEELFSGALQDRYPLPRAKGQEPTYKRRDQLTAEEREWNVRQLRKSAQARLEHADALEAEALQESAA
jgi:hypothetical protein